MRGRADPGGDPTTEGRFVDSAVASFLAPPRGTVAVLADAVRVVGLLTFLVAIPAWGGVGASVFALALLGLVAPRFLGARPGIDLAIGLTVFIAAVSNVFDLYVRFTWWDIPVHLITTGVLTLLVVLAADRAGVVFDRRRWALGALSLAIGLALSALWEMGEWAGYTFVDSGIYVGYDDTVLDMVAGGIGSVIAAALVAPALDRSRWRPVTTGS